MTSSTISGDLAIELLPLILFDVVFSKDTIAVAAFFIISYYSYDPIIEATIPYTLRQQEQSQLLVTPHLKLHRLP